ncbi:MAG: uroporphyrinogen decarboxylase family protein [Acidobacteriota bacterium]|nr:uroporphyrinogen decarboxylase family protein [Acidobacteriota bacterium]
MTHRERILKAIQGEIPDRLPWVPRLEFWHRARLRQGTLPPELQSLSLTEISASLGVGCYSSIPDFADTTYADAMLDRALGIVNHPVLPYRVTLENVDRRIIKRGREIVVEYHTPVGSIRTSMIFTDEMLDSGVSVPWTVDHAIQKPQDFEVVGHIMSNLRIEPQFQGYLAHRQEIGEQGLAVGFLQGTACPIHYIMRELMPLDQFFFALHDEPERVHRLADKIAPFFQQTQAIGADSPAEVLMVGGNYDDSITYPAFFEKYIFPALRDYADELHRRGKFLMTHTDGENQKLFPLYRRAGFDIADSVCPYPMTRCTLNEIRTSFGEHVTIWGGIPSTLLCATSTPEDEFRHSVDAIVERYGHQTHFILGVSDMVTADCEWDRLQYITDKVGGT